MQPSLSVSSLRLLRVRVRAQPRARVETLVLAAATAVFGASAGRAAEATANLGAEIPWVTTEAEAMQTNGEVLGPRYEPHQIAVESSGQRAVVLDAAGEYVEWRAPIAANALVVRFNLPDGPTGGGTRAGLKLLRNGTPVRTLALSSRNQWLYGDYPFSNDPAKGRPRNFYDEVRAHGVEIAAGDLLRLELGAGDVPCTLDLVDLELVPAPLTAPEGALSIRDFGAAGDGEADDTVALRACIAAAAAVAGEGASPARTVWVPPGRYKITGDILVPSFVRIQGAGMWHTTFVGDEALYDQADRRVRFKLTGREMHLADFAIIGALNYRHDQEPNDGIVGAGCAHATIARVWIEHTKAGVWVYNGSDLRIEGCRFRNLIADGVNFCVGTTRSVIDNCTARGTGDDCFAIWPAASDQGFDDDHVVPGDNVIRRCTGKLTFLANGAAIYGGANNRIEDCLFTDIGTGCGILLCTTFPTADEARGIDNNFSGTTVVRNVRLVRCGGWDHHWGWRGSLQICLDRRSIAGLQISHVDIVDSISDGVTVVAPGRAKGEGTLAATRLEAVCISRVGLGDPARHPLWIREDAAGGLTLAGCTIDGIRNDSAAFTIEQE